MTDILIVSLATYGMCKLVSEYDGPFNVFQRIRSQFKAFLCLACSSVWVCAPLALFTGLSVVEYFAAIGIVLILDWIVA